MAIFKRTRSWMSLSVNWPLILLVAVLAIPLTLLLKVVLVDGDPRAAWADALLSSARRVQLLRTRTAAPVADDHPRSELPARRPAGGS